MNKEILHAYIRVSTDGQVATSIPEQKLDAENKAKSLGMELEIYVDEGISASKTDNINNRPEMQRLLEDIAERKVKHLYTEDSTRLSREDVASAVIFGRIKAYGVILYYKNGSALNLQNPQDKLQAGILDNFAQYEGAVRMMRFEMGLKQASRKGKYVGSNHPYGYNKDENSHLIYNEEEKEIFLSIVKQFLSGDGTYKIAQRLNAKGISTRSMKKGKPIKWNAGTIRSMLQNTVYKGKRTYKNIEIDSPPIIDKETFDLVQKQFAKNRIHSKRNNTVHKYLLKGLIKCGCKDCGQNYFGKIKESRGERLYVCLSKRTGYKSCDNKNINLDRIDNAIFCAIRHTPHFYSTLHKEYKGKYNETEILAEIESLELNNKRLEKEYERLITKMVSLPSDAPEIAMTTVNKLIKEKEKEIKVVVSDLEKSKSKLASKDVNPLSLLDKKFVKNGAIHVDNIDDKIMLIKQIVESIVVTYIPKKNEHKIELHLIGSKPTMFFLSAKQYRYRKGFELQDDAFRYSNENGLLYKSDGKESLVPVKENFSGLV